MSDWFHGQIAIGGPIPKKIVPRLIKAILKEGVNIGDDLNEEGPAADAMSLAGAIRDGEILELYDMQARYGQFEHLEEFLIKHHIHFTRHSDGYLEFDPETVYYRGGKEAMTMMALNDGGDVISCQTVLDIIDGNESIKNCPTTAKGKLELIRRLAAPPQTAPLTPICLT